MDMHGDTQENVVKQITTETPSLSPSDFPPLRRSECLAQIYNQRLTPIQKEY